MDNKQAQSPCFFLPVFRLPSAAPIKASSLFLLPAAREEASQTQRAAAMASPDAEQPAPTEPERWRDLDMLLSRPGNLVEASFDPSPGVSGLPSIPPLLRCFLAFFYP